MRDLTKKRDGGMSYKKDEHLKSFELAHMQCECGSELMAGKTNGEGRRRFYCPGSKRFFWEGGSCEDGSMFAAPI